MCKITVVECSSSHINFFFNSSNLIFNFRIVES